jgi:signal transduction histidine kinase/ligand-binding sensor domain-containing protein
MDGFGDVWASTPAGVYRKRYSQDRFEPFSNQPGVRAFVEDVNGIVWASGPNLALIPIERATAPWLAPTGMALRGAPLLRDRRRNLWLATLGDGLIRIDFSDPGRPRSVQLKGELTSDVVRSFLEDREGNIWIGTQRGLNRLFRSVITSLPGTGDPPMSRYVRAIARGVDAAMWIGSSEGLYRFDRETWTRYTKADGLPGPQVTALHVDHAGDIWVATTAGVGRFAGGRFASVPNLSHLTSVTSMTTDLEGHLWLCDAQRGLVSWNRSSGSAVALPAIVSPYTAFTDSHGRVWIGTVNGAVFAHNAGAWRSYSRVDGLTDRTVTGVFEDRDGALWFGVIGGLSRFDGQRFVTLTEKSGLPGNSVQAIIQDGNGDFWLGLNSGIMRTSPAEMRAAASNPSHRLRYTLYDSSDGLRGTPVSMGQPLVAAEPDGTLWFTTSDGLALVNPGRANRERLPPPVRIESVMAGDQTMAPGPGLRLPRRTTHLEIGYTALSFVSPAKVRFRYRLEGFDSDWVDAGSRRRAFYTNLPPQHYRFRVAAVNGGVWSESEAAWEFSIAPMFYQTRLFLATCVAATLLALVGAWRLRERQVRRSFSLVLAERTRMAREIHDTLIQNMVGVALQFDTLVAELPSSPSATRTIDRLRRQTELSIREARQAILDLRSPMLERHSLVNALRESGERITAGNGVRFTFQVTGLPRVGTPRTEQQLLRIAQEAVTNAVRHARASRVQMDLRYDANSVVLRVVDDGRGFDLEHPEERLEDHLGLASMQERTKQMGGHFHVSTAPGQGTAIEAVAPM